MNLKLAELLESIPPEFNSRNSPFAVGFDFYFEKRTIRIFTFPDGSPESMSYFLDDTLDRPPSQGPAWQIWNNNGDLISCSYWIKGVLIKHNPLEDKSIIKS